jgi:hypothetical protein
VKEKEREKAKRVDPTGRKRVVQLDGPSGWITE